MYIVIKLFLALFVLEFIQCTYENDNHQYNSVMDHENNRIYKYIDNYLWLVVIKIKDKLIRDEPWKYGSLIRRTVVLTHQANIIGFTANNLTIVRDCQWMNTNTTTEPTCNVRNVIYIENQKSLNIAILFIESPFDDDALIINKRMITSVTNEKIWLYIFYINTLKLAKQSDVINGSNCFTNSWVKKSLSNNKQGLVRVSTRIRAIDSIDGVHSIANHNDSNVEYGFPVFNPYIAGKLNNQLNHNNRVRAFIGSPIVCQLTHYPLRYVQIGIESGGFNILKANSRNDEMEIIALGEQFIKIDVLEKKIIDIINK